jgi:integrase
MRERKPYERRSKGRLIGWYILWEGRQTWLGRFEAEAKENLKRLKAGEPVVRPERITAPRFNELTVRDIVETFLDHQQAQRSTETYLWYRRFLKSFCEFDGIGRLPVSHLKRSMVHAWINANRNKAADPKNRIKPWTETTANCASRAVVAAFNHAVKMDELKASPVKDFEKPTATPRENCELTPAEWKRLMEAVDDPAFKDAILFMRLTGARPMECRNAEKRHFHPNIPALIFPKLESKGKKRERLIRLSGDALLIVQKLAMKYPEGKLFRNADGSPWTKDAFARRFKRLSKRLKMPNLIPYSLRHTYATEGVIKGIDSIVLAKLMGHTSTKMLEHVYAKHARRDDFMNEMAAKAVEGIA